MNLNKELFSWKRMFLRTQKLIVNFWIETQNVHDYLTVFFQHQSSLASFGKPFPQAFTVFGDINRKKNFVCAQRKTQDFELNIFSLLWDPSECNVHAHVYTVLPWETTWQTQTKHSKWSHRFFFYMKYHDAYKWKTITFTEHTPCQPKRWLFFITFFSLH